MNISSLQDEELVRNRVRKQEVGDFLSSQQNRLQQHRLCGSIIMEGLNQMTEVVRQKAEGADLPQDRRPFAFIPVLPWRINDGRILNCLFGREVAVILQSLHGNVTKLSANLSP